MHLRACVPQLLRLLRSASEQKRVPALETDDDLPFGSVLHQELVGLPLAEVVVAGPLPGIDELGALFALLEELGIRQSIVEHNIRRPQELQAPDGEQPGIPRTCANQIHLAGHMITSLFPTRYSAMPRSSSIT